ncbi:hypothetical protein HYW46_06145 [Candidatus Daviesbacteria bacterium]|nr:hypothetical protein [Candidatus Daviesbacteria bacterium]
MINQFNETPLRCTLERFLSKKMFFRVILVFYLFACLVFYPFYKYQINVDAIAYLSISKKYLNADFYNAVNGYWSPLLSITYLPFLAIGLDQLEVTKLTSIIFGAVVLFLLKKILGTLKIELKYTNLLLLSLVPTIIYFGYTVISPDLLFLAIFTIYIFLILSKKYLKSYKHSVLIGLIGSLLYLTKSFGFIFFIAHFTLVNLVFFISFKQKRRLIKSVLFAFLTFCVISGIWIIIISNKYGYLTFGTSAKHNHAIIGPKLYPRPFFDNRIFIPPNATALTASEDPSYLEIEDWNSISSLWNLKYQFFIFRNNLLRALILLSTLSIFMVPIFLLALYKMYTFRERIKNNPNLLLLTLSGFMYPLLYSNILVEERYLWPVSVVGAILFFLFFKKIRSFFLTLFLISLVIYPTSELYKNINSGKQYYQLAQEVGKLNLGKFNFASNNSVANSQFIAFYNKSRYFGKLGDFKDRPLLVQMLKSYGINYYFVWEENKMKNKLKGFLPEINQNKIPELKIYKVN